LCGVLGFFGVGCFFVFLFFFVFPQSCNGSSIFSVYGLCLFLPLSRLTFNPTPCLPFSNTGVFFGRCIERRSLRSQTGILVPILSHPLSFSAPCTTFSVPVFVARTLRTFEHLTHLFHRQSSHRCPGRSLPTPPLSSFLDPYLKVTSQFFISKESVRVIPLLPNDKIPPFYIGSPPLLI